MRSGSLSTSSSPSCVHTPRSSPGRQRVSPFRVTTTSSSRTSTPVTSSCNRAFTSDMGNILATPLDSSLDQNSGQPQDYWALPPFVKMLSCRRIYTCAPSYKTDHVQVVWASALYARLAAIERAATAGRSSQSFSVTRYWCAISVDAMPCRRRCSTCRLLLVSPLRVS